MLGRKDGSCCTPFFFMRMPEGKYVRAVRRRRVELDLNNLQKRIQELRQEIPVLAAIDKQNCARGSS
jgi:hypothetical protein